MTGKHREDPKLAVLRDEVDSFFRNELCDEALMGVQMTRLALTPDRKMMTVYYLAPEGREELARSKIEDLGPILADLAFPILERRAEVRFKWDRGAENQRRVEELLREIHGGEDSGEGGSEDGAARTGAAWTRGEGGDRRDGGENNGDSKDRDDGGDGDGG